MSKQKTPKIDVKSKASTPKVIDNDSDDNVETNETSSEPKKKLLPKNTTEANLNWNVNRFKTWIKKYIERNIDKNYDKNDDDENENQPQKITLAHIALGAMNEELCYQIINITKNNHVQKGKNGLYNISRRAMTYAIKLNRDMSLYFSSSVDSYDRTMQYSDQFCILQKDVKAYIDKMLGNDVRITDKACDFLIYLLVRASNDIVSSAYHIMTYAGYKSMNEKSIITAIKIKFDKTEELQNNLIIKTMEAIKNVKPIKTDEKDTKPKDDEENDNKEEEEEKPKNQKNIKSNKKEEIKKNTKSKPSKEEEDEESGVIEVKDDDSEEEQKPKIKPKGKNK